MFVFKESPQVVRKVQSQNREVFLSFDDGPDAGSTSVILDVLQKENVRANFFVIGTAARKNPALLERLLGEGHGVFSHSVDHRYAPYFLGEAKLKYWLLRSLEDLAEQTQHEQKIFRPPAGILTPPLQKIAKDLNVPLVLWKHRFFDTVSEFTEEKVARNIRVLHPGDIILLHDRQKNKNLRGFSKTLQSYLQQVKQLGFQFSVISSSNIESQVVHARAIAKQ